MHGLQELGESAKRLKESYKVLFDEVSLGCQASDLWGDLHKAMTTQFHRIELWADKIADAQEAGELTRQEKTAVRLIVGSADGLEKFKNYAKGFVAGVQWEDSKLGKALQEFSGKLTEFAEIAAPFIKEVKSTRSAEAAPNLGNNIGFGGIPPSLN